MVQAITASRGDVSFNGAGSLTASGNLAVTGNNAVAGGLAYLTVTVPVSVGRVRVAHAAGENATLSVGVSGSVMTGTASIGTGSSGEMIVNGGSFTSTGDLTVGAAGQVTLLGGGALLIGPSAPEGRASFTVGTGGAVFSTHTEIAAHPGGNASVGVSGHWQNTYSLFVGGYGGGAGGLASLTVNSGGTLAVGETLNVWNTGSGVDGLVLSGGTVSTGPSISTATPRASWATGLRAPCASRAAPSRSTTRRRRGSGRRGPWEPAGRSRLWPAG
ncbi:MAG TPA: hypothetical protein VER17_05215 [Tepidisphaeraceae bacterium]|nr:hypothetical protein [Tepidisphaeraceae bacterium]